MAERRKLHDQFLLRLPDGMREQLAAEAEASGRSTNAEIVLRLQRSFSDASSEEVEQLRRRQELFMPFFSGLLESAKRLVDELPVERRLEPGPAMMITLIAGMFDGGTEGKKVLEIVDALGPVLGVQREKVGGDEDAAASIDALRSNLRKSAHVGSNIDLIEEAGRAQEGKHERKAK